MYSLYLAAAIALVVALLPMAFGVSPIWTILPGVLLGVGAFVWMNRRIARRVEAVTGAADREMAQMQAAAQRPGPQTQANMFRHIDQAITILERGFALQKWQVGIGTMLNARIGMLIYTRWLLGQQMAQSGGGRAPAGPGLLEAIPYLEKSRVKGTKARLLSALWPAWAMLAVAYYKGRKDTDAALAVLEDSVKVAGKNGILWALYAWILEQSERVDAAIDVLVRGKAAASDDPRLAENLTLLQNNKSMKMRGYGEQWYQFGLERPKVAGMQPRMGHPRMRGGPRRR
ncbi:MAG: tetratricopeptide repeat protein [bacterium]